MTLDRGDRFEIHPLPSRPSIEGAAVRPITNSSPAWPGGVRCTGSKDCKTAQNSAGRNVPAWDHE